MSGRVQCLDSGQFETTVGCTRTVCPRGWSFHDVGGCILTPEPESEPDPLPSPQPEPEPQPEPVPEPVPSDSIDSASPIPQPQGPVLAYGWSIASAFLACPDACGTQANTATRSVVCMASDGTVAQFTDCNAGLMPSESMQCLAVLDGAMCDDGDDETNNDVCAGVTCAGKVALVSQLTFDIAVDVVEGTQAFVDMEQSIKGALASTLSGANLNCSADDITIIGIFAGSLVVDYKVELPAAAITPQVKTSAIEALADPASAMSTIVIVDASGVAVTAGAPTVQAFKSYAWKKEAESCSPTASCGVAETNLADAYVCQENAGVGLSDVTDAFCSVPLGPKPATQTTCAGSALCPTCSDWTRNGDETALDCGGTACSPCATTAAATEPPPPPSPPAGGTGSLNATAGLSSVMILSPEAGLDAGSLIVVLVVAAAASAAMLGFYRHAKLTAATKGSVVYLAGSDIHGDDEDGLHIPPSLGGFSDVRSSKASSPGSMSLTELPRRQEQEFARQQDRERRHRDVDQRKNKSSAVAQSSSTRRDAGPRQTQEADSDSESEQQPRTSHSAEKRSRRADWKTVERAGKSKWSKTHRIPSSQGSCTATYTAEQHAQQSRQQRQQTLKPLQARRGVGGTGDSTDETDDEDADDPYNIARELIRRGDRGTKLQAAVRSLVKDGRLDEAQTVFVLARKTALTDAGMHFDPRAAQDDFIAALKRWQHPESVQPAKKKKTVSPVRVAPAPGSVPPPHQKVVGHANGGVPTRVKPVGRQAQNLRNAYKAAKAAGAAPALTVPRLSLRAPGSISSPNPRSSLPPPPRPGQVASGSPQSASGSPGGGGAVRRSPLELMAMMQSEGGGGYKVPPPPKR